MNVGEDLHRDSTPDSVKLTTMEQLEVYVRTGNEDAARQLFAHEVINLKTPEGGDLLWTAYALNQNEMATMLVQHGANLSTRKHVDNRTLLHHMLRGSRIDSTVTRNLFCLMLDFGANVNARDDEGKTLLHDAITSCHEGSTKLVEELLKRGAQVTINKKKPSKDHIHLACRNKIELLPKLIQHQNPGVKMRNCRATVAIHSLISRKYADDKIAYTALLVMEQILQRGVPEDVLAGHHSKRKMSFLNRALHHKNLAAVQLLLKYGAELHHKTRFGHTCLYQATSFKDTTKVSRWFIESGVSIEVRNNNGDYPIHGACKHESLKNLHLMTNLGADLNSTNLLGQTPFDLMKLRKEKKINEAHQLVIKHLALKLVKDGKLNEKDRTKINQYNSFKRYFDNCLKQLKEMKVQKVHSDVPYFSLLSKNMYSMMQLVEDKKFIKRFKKDGKRRNSLFPYYSIMLSHSFEIATRRLGVLLEKQKDLGKVFMGILPNSVLSKLAYYVYFEELKHYNDEFFMSFHERQDNR